MKEDAELRTLAQTTADLRARTRAAVEAMEVLTLEAVPREVRDRALEIVGRLDAGDQRESLAAVAKIIAEAERTHEQARAERESLAVERRRLTQIHEAALAAEVARIKARQSAPGGFAGQLEEAYARGLAAARPPQPQAAASQRRPRRPPPCRDAAGHDLRPDPLAARTGAELMETLRRFHQWAGRPPYREMAARCGHRAAASTMNTALRRDEMPDRLWLLDAIVEGCGGSEEDRAGFSTTWRMLTGNTSAGTGDGTPSRLPRQASS